MIQIKAASFLLGKPLRDGTVLSEVRSRLQARSIAVTVHVATGDGLLPAGLEASTLVIQRGLGLCDLNAARRLEQAGVRCCNRIAATIAVADRAATVRTLAAAGVLVPATIRVATWDEVVKVTADTAVVVKSADATIGRGRHVLQHAAGRLADQEPFAGPYIVQEYVPNDGSDVKVYMVGRHARGLVKQPSGNTAERATRPFAVFPGLARVARRVGRALDLEIYGADFLQGPHGPVVVDVNPFPGFRGVAGAPDLIARYVMSLA